jgi:predicted Zn finger-like uncharacterized protein
MIAGCPTCAARYRIDTAKLPAEGARLRCSRCETVFRVRPPESSETERPAAAPAPPRSTGPVPIRSAAPARRPAPPAAPPDPEKLVLIAHPDKESGKAVADAVVSWGLSSLLVHDGVEAILQIQRTLPRVVVLDAALPKMFGFQICELMKRNEQLRSIPVVLVGAIHDQSRYRRSPNELYGADAYLERHQLPEGLADLLANLAPLGQGAERAVAEPPAAPPRAAAAPATPVAPAPPAAPPAPAAERAARPAPSQGSPEVEKAQRLARIIVSDVILYNQEKFDAGVRAGNVVDALGAELEEGYALFAQRVDANVCEPREYLQRELVRVARSRGMK